MTIPAGSCITTLISCRAGVRLCTIGRSRGVIHAIAWASPVRKSMGTFPLELFLLASAAVRMEAWSRQRHRRGKRRRKHPSAQQRCSRPTPRRPVRLPPGGGSFICVKGFS